MVIHYKNVDDEIVCKSKAKKISSTTDKALVTCKRCLKKLNAKPTDKKPTKKKPIPSKIKYVFDKKLKHCLQINNNAILKLGDDTFERIGTMILFHNRNMVSTSIKFCGPIISILSAKEIKYLRNWFLVKKEETGNKILISDVIEAFTLKKD